MIWDNSIKKDRFDIEKGDLTMKAIVTSGNGSYEKLECRQVKRPKLEPGEVLVKVLAAGVNNTDINTRIGWYSKEVTSNDNKKEVKITDGGWNEQTPFPFIQGTDCCGEVVQVYPGDNDRYIGLRVLIRSCIRKYDFQHIDHIWMGSDFDGAFAQYVKIKATEVFPVNCSWSNAELATIPCAYGTSENMLERSQVTKKDKVLIVGASGGVGSASVQLAKRRGAYVVGIASANKIEQVKKIGIDRVVARGENLIEIFGEEYFDVVVDNVAGDGFGDMIKLLKRKGRYVSSGAIGGAFVTLDMRDLYLKDLTLIGCTAWEECVFPNLISYIEKGEIKPIVAKIAPLEDIGKVQEEFLKKNHVGNFVLIPPEAE